MDENDLVILVQEQKFCLQQQPRIFTLVTFNVTILLLSFIYFWLISLHISMFLDHILLSFPSAIIHPSIWLPAHHPSLIEVAYKFENLYCVIWSKLYIKSQKQKNGKSWWQLESNPRRGTSTHQLYGGRKLWYLVVLDQLLGQRSCLKIVKMRIQALTSHGSMMCIYLTLKVTHGMLQMFPWLEALSPELLILLPSTKIAW